MRRRSMLRSMTALLSLGPLAAACQLPFRRKKAQQHNILMLVVDDLNSWVGCLDDGLGGPRAHTPAIDALANQGILFRQAYCPAPYCNASRLAVFSGRGPLTTGVYQDQPFWEQDGRPATYLELLKQQGYATFSAGKVLHGLYDYRSAAQQAATSASWINREDRRFLWDHRAEMPAEPLPWPRPLHGMQEEWGTGRKLSPQLDWGALPDDQLPVQPDVQNANTVIQWLQDPPPQPFFMALGLYRPHLPWYVAQSDLDRYPLDALPLPRVLANDLDDVPDIAKTWALNPADHATITGNGQWKQAVQAYLASITFTDRQIGRVLDALKSSPAADNTTVVLWSDNGFHLGEKLHWRKFTLWEEATRVPFIIVPPRGANPNPTPQVIDTPVSLLDLFPTLFELEGLRPPKTHLDGHRLGALFNHTSGGDQRKPSIEMAPMTSWQDGNHSLRWGSWRYTRYRTGEEELYDHASDAQEWHNLVRASQLSTQQQQALAQLRQELQRRISQAQRPQP